MWTLPNTAISGVLTRYVIDMPPELMLEILGALSLLCLDTQWIGDNENILLSVLDACNRMNISIVEYVENTAVIGQIVTHALATLPSEWLACDGTTYLRIDYPELYAVLDAAFIVDADHFITPNIVDKFVKSVANGEAVGAIGGAHSVQLTAAQLPAHPHTFSWYGTSVTVTSGSVGVNVASRTKTSGSTNDAGGGQTHENRPAFISLKYAIVAK